MINQKTGCVTPGKFFPTPSEIHKMEQNKSTSASEKFKKGCAAAGIPETKRQAVKFKNKRGKAYSFAE